MIGSKPKTKEEQELWEESYYEYEKNEAFERADFYCDNSTNIFRECLIAYLSCTSYLNRMKNDEELSLTKKEYQLARKWAYKKEKEKLWEYGLDINNLGDLDDIKEYLEAKGYSDLVEMDNEWN